MARLPDFLIIGAQKAGTSWLHHHMRRHPGIFMPEAKDQGYFCWCDGPQALTLEHYQQSFDPAAMGQLIGEATAAYFWTGSGSQWDIKPEGYCPDIPGRVLDTLSSDTRLVLSLRDPVERAVSAYLHHIAFGDLDPAVSLLEAGDFIGLLDIGFYAAHLRNWLRYFPRRQFLVLDFEKDIRQQPDASLQRVFGFLGVDVAWQPGGVEQPVFQGRQRTWLEDSVWVPAEDYPGGLSGDSRQLDGRTYRCLVDRQTINTLREIYAQDQELLQGLLR